MCKIHKLFLVMIFIYLSACTSDLPKENSREETPFSPHSVAEDPINNTTELEEQPRALQTEPHEPLDKAPVSPLPFKDFKERWNAITEERLSNLYIRDMHEASDENGAIYSAVISGGMDLNIYVSEDIIYQLEMVSKINGSNEVIKMLEGWNQIIEISHPNIKFHDIDGFFHEIGVGPNADLTNVTERTLTFNEVDYTIIPMNEGYLFKASYPKQS